MAESWSPCKCFCYVDVEASQLEPWRVIELNFAFNQVETSDCKQDHFHRKEAYSELPDEEPERGQMYEKQIQYGSFMSSGLVTCYKGDPYMRGILSKSHLGAARAWLAKFGADSARNAPIADVD